MYEEKLPCSKLAMIMPVTNVASIWVSIKPDVLSGYIMRSGNNRRSGAEAEWCTSMLIMKEK